MKPLLSVLVPLYNEKDTLRELLRRVLEAAPADKEVILIDDGSTDGSREILKNEIERRYPNVHIVYHEKNQGKGTAIRSGLKAASGDIVIIQDADLEYDPQDFQVILREFDKGAEVVYGTRFKHDRVRIFLWHWLQNRFGAHHRIKRIHHYLGVRFLNRLTNLLYGTNITDEATCYKAFRRALLSSLDLQCRGFEFCPEVTAKIRKKGVTITEVPISYTPRTEKSGKKLNWKHGIEAIWTLIKYRFID